MRKQNREIAFQQTCVIHQINYSLMSWQKCQTCTLRNRTVQAAFHDCQTMVLKCPLTVPSHLLVFVLYCQVGVMTKRKDKTNRTTYCGRSHFKDQRADSVVAAKIRTAVGGSSAWCPEKHRATLGGQHLGPQALHPAQEDNLLRLKVPYPFTAFDLNSIVR